MVKINNMFIHDLKEYENNPRKNDEAVDYVKESIREFGFKVPIIVDKEYNIITGHTRKKAALELGIKEVPVIIADDLNEEQIQAFRLADNKVAEFSQWDEDLLLDELSQLEDMDMGEFGFDLGDMFEEEDEVEEDDFEEEVPEEPKSQVGQIYQLGRHRLMCGDSTNEEDVKKLTDNNKIDMVFTDPPYGMNAVSNSGVLSKTYGNDIMNDNDNTVAYKSWQLCDGLFNESKQIWWGANYYSEYLPSSECWLVWNKNNGQSDQTDCELAWSNMRSVVRMFTLSSEKTNRVHPTQKPIKMITDVFSKFDKDKSINNIIDLFGGSGSTLMACEQTGRNAYLMELDPRYVDVIINRWEQYTGEEAELLNG